MKIDQSGEKTKPPVTLWMRIRIRNSPTSVVNPNPPRSGFASSTGLQAAFIASIHQNFSFHSIYSWAAGVVHVPSRHGVNLRLPPWRSPYRYLRWKPDSWLQGPSMLSWNTNNNQQSCNLLRLRLINVETQIVNKYWQTGYKQLFKSRFVNPDWLNYRYHPDPAF
jgi:hypothetical protein